MQPIVEKPNVKRGGRFIDLTGKKIGRLLVVELSGFRRGKHLYWRCRCDCGSIKDIAATSLQGEVTRSCGCLVFENRPNLQHGLTGSREWTIWRDMKRRCRNPNRDDYHLYGGRGIKVCDIWRDSFPAFLRDMGKCPEGKTLGRRDNDADYSPKNCQWETSQQQANNRRNNHFLECFGLRMTMAQWSRHIPMRYQLIVDRCRRGWSPLEIFTREST